MTFLSTTIIEFLLFFDVDSCACILKNALLRTIITSLKFLHQLIFFCPQRNQNQ